MESYQKAATIIGKNIRVIRESKQLHQCELARRCHMEPSNLNRIEAGLTNPTLRSICIIAEGLGVKLSDFFKGL